MARVGIARLKCKRCNHEWTPRKEDVRICPNCRSPYWDIEREKKIGKQ